MKDDIFTESQIFEHLATCCTSITHPFYKELIYVHPIVLKTLIFLILFL